nr:hypothetical protein WMHIBSEC_WMHIBSEC_CDS_0044 [Caudoviricetes sp.]CAI9751221.1 hypothetical protein WMHIBSEC_WMHIBSEC_CDS_0045 [Caudoviricetes sp.]CAI9751767.1 hypothetical protein AZFZUZMX_AZFZUZMX_CDS_0044 [Caudoviricetes sp.]CAI9751770.1 hypothetical protein AZFZUZMX_AZFZUZMX_CDS_0045 [Caudoviricetes sp.]
MRETVINILAGVGLYYILSLLVRIGYTIHKKAKSKFVCDSTTIKITNNEQQKD